jgi:hypothetical protein
MGTIGIQSIARSALSGEGGSPKLVFDPRAFPKGEAEPLASGWNEHYWDPLTQSSLRVSNPTMRLKRHAINAWICGCT